MNGAKALLDVPQIGRLVRGQLWGLDTIWRSGDEASRRLAVARLIELGIEMAEAARGPQRRESVRIVPFGKVTVAAAGAPVQVTATATPVNAMVFSSVAGSVKMFVGTLNLNAGTGANVLGELLQPAGGPSDRLRIDAEEGNQLDASSFYVDAAANGGTLYAFGLQQ